MYLDNAATTPLNPRVRDYILSIIDEYGNPSSIYSIGNKSKTIIEESREIVADSLNCDADDIIFTSGGSASNTLAIKGYTVKNTCDVAYLPTCHKSILKCVNGIYGAYPISVDNKGALDFVDLRDWLQRAHNPFVIIEFANSEIGTIQRVKEIADLVHFYNGVIYVDCTGSFSTIPVDIKYLGADMIGFSGHKIGALKGIGVLYKRSGIDLEPLIYGSQEQGLFGGTENILGIASIGKAIQYHNYDHETLQRDHFYTRLIKEIPDCYLVGESLESGYRLSHNLFVCIKGVDGEALVTMMDLEGDEISTGSACNNRQLQPSSTLKAIGIDENDIHSCLRFTFSGNEDLYDLDKVFENLKKCVNTLRLLKER